MEEEKRTEIELHEERAMIYLPIDAVELTITAKIYSDGELQTAQKKLSMHELRKAFQDAADNYLEDDDEFVITEKGLRWLESLENKRVI